MSEPQVLLESVLVCKIKEPANHCSEEKGRGRHHTKPQDSNKNVLEIYVTQRPCHLQAARPKHPCQPQWVPPALRDHVTPETAVVGGIPGWRTAGIILSPLHEYANTD